MGICIVNRQEKSLTLYVQICDTNHKIDTTKFPKLFTIDQIQTAHSKVRSGADFPAFFEEIKQLGVTSYESFVSDGHTNYFGAGDSRISSTAKYNTLSIAEICTPEQFKSDLTAHQLGKTDYPTFCKDCAKSGIEKWIISMDKMTCTYFDKIGKEVLVERIPTL